jgi:hypothetical protein
MKRAEDKTGSKQLRSSERNPRIVPLVVPHGCAEAGRDFESAFDVLQGDSQVHELWRRSSRTKLVRAS